MGARRWVWIVWPAFLSAAVMEMLVFASFHPQDILWLAGVGGLSPLTVYTVAFFAFWAIFSVAGYVTVLLSLSAADMNMTADQRSTTP